MRKSAQLRAPLVLTALLLFPQISTANDFYLQLNGGTSYLKDMKSDFRDEPIRISSERGFNVGGAIGYRIKGFRVEASVDYLRANVNKVEVLGETYNSRKHSYLLTGMANGYYDIDLGSSVKPYIGGGVGVGHIQLDEHQGDLVETDGKYGRGTTFAWNVMAGLTWSVNDRIDLLVGYRYVETLKVKMNGDVESLAVAGSFKVKMTANELRFGLRYNF